MLTLILKATNACNLRCSYCSLGEKSEPAALSEDAMERALGWFCGYARERGERKLSVILHGGEPMLIPAERYDRVLERTVGRHGDMEIAFKIQTNGTVLSDAYLALFRKYAFRIGVSLDGLRHIHDGQRRDASGGATYDRVAANIRRLLAERLPVSALMVLTRPSLGAGYGYLELMAQLGVPIKINPLLETGEALVHRELCLEAGDYGNYLIGLHRYVLEKEAEVHISPLEELQQAVIHRTSPAGCTFRASCSRSFLCIDQEGRLYPCGRFADQRRFPLGDIWGGMTEDGKRTLEGLVARREKNLPEKCRTCRDLGMCRAGCSATADGSLGDPCAMCSDYRMLFDYLRGDGLQRYKEYLLKKKRQLEEGLRMCGGGYGV